MDAFCSARLLQPFLRFVAEGQEHRDLVPDGFWSVNPDARVSVDQTHRMVLHGVERFRDPRLGLKLGRSMRLGEGGPFDYAVESAGTLRESVEVAGRFSGLISDSFRIWCEPWHGYSLIRVLDEVSWATPFAEFALSAFYKLHLAEKLPADSNLECWFAYSEPADTSEHVASFPGVRLRFAAPFFGFAFDRTYEEAPLPGADPVLHAAHCERVSSLLAEVSRPQLRVSPRVRQHIMRELEVTTQVHGNRVAAKLGMSRRTMSRRLEEEGTSFASLLDEVRRELALLYVGQSEESFGEIAALLGFSHTESLYRAFKRWTGRTPLAYRASPANVGYV